MERVKVILVGGFLGAGKTTLLAQAAQRLVARGLRVGLITNDQAVNLVDTEQLRLAGSEVKEVAGACFCCAFNKLLHVCDELIASHKPDVIVGEPVGSCTDLAATVIAPLKTLCADRFNVAPYSVLVDPARLQQAMGELATGDLAAAVRYIYRKQIEEADLLVVNKADALAPARREKVLAALAAEAPHAPAVTMSALTGEGVDAWLDRVLAGGPAGGHIAEVDYDTYAAGEAALGWLNAAVELTAQAPDDWKRFAAAFMNHAQRQLQARSADIAHLKILLVSPGGRLQMNLTSSDGTASTLGGLLTPSTNATLIVNARVRTTPEDLKAVVESSLHAAAGDSVSVNLADLASFRPGRPQPIHRFPSTTSTDSPQ